MGDIMIDVLERAGVTGSLAKQAQHVLIVYAIGSAAYSTVTPPSDIASPQEHDDEDARAFLSGLDWLIAGIGL